MDQHRSPSSEHQYRSPIDHPQHHPTLQMHPFSNTPNASILRDLRSSSILDTCPRRFASAGLPTPPTLSTSKQPTLQTHLSEDARPASRSQHSNRINRPDARPASIIQQLTRNRPQRCSLTAQSRRSSSASTSHSTANTHNQSDTPSRSDTPTHTRSLPDLRHLRSNQTLTHTITIRHTIYSHDRHRQSQPHTSHVKDKVKDM